jgi:hypothetical protein
MMKVTGQRGKAADSASACNLTAPERFQLFARRLASIPTKQPTNDVAGSAPPPPPARIGRQTRPAGKTARDRPLGKRHAQVPPKNNGGLKNSGCENFPTEARVLKTSHRSVHRFGRVSAELLDRLRWRHRPRKATAFSTPSSR